MEEYSLGATLLQFSFALAFVIALLFLCAHLAKKMGFIARVTVKKDGDSEKRLAITEIMPIDAKRRLVLIKRDDTEHLIMLGAERDIIIEQNINSDNKNKTTSSDRK